MPVDPEISLHAETPNALGLIGQFANTSNALTQMQLNRQQLLAKQALGPLFQQSIDPQTGEIDYNKFLSKASQDPNAAILVPELANQIKQRELTQVQIGGALQTQGQELVKNFMGDVAASASDPSQLGNLLTTRLSTASPELRNKLQQPLGKYVNAITSGLPGAPGSVEQKRAYGNKARAAALDAQLPKDALQYLFGETSLQDAGDRLIPMIKDPFTGEMTQAGPAISKGLAPTVAAGPYGPQGRPQVNVLGGGGGQPWYNPQPQSSTLAPQGGAGSQAPATAAGGNALGGSPPPTARASGAVLSGITPQQQQFQDAAGKDAAEDFKNLNDRVRVGGAIMTRLSEMVPLMDQARIGGGAETWTALSKLAQTMGAPDALVNKIQGGSLPAAQEFEKFAVQTNTEVLKQIMTGAVGKITNMEWSKFQEANPNLETDPRAIQKMFNFISRVYKIDRAEQGAMADAMKEPGFDPLQWPNRWQSEAIKRGLWSPDAPQSKAGNAPMPRGKAGGPVKVSSPDEARKLAPGTHFLTPDGREMVRP